MFTQLVLPTRNIVLNHRAAVDQLAHLGAGWSTCAHHLVQFAVGMDVDAQMSPQELYHALAEYYADTGLANLHDIPYNQQAEIGFFLHELFIALRHHIDAVLHQRIPNGFISGVTAANQTLGHDLVVDIEISSTGWSRNGVRQDASHV